jgi:hypothetical protein
VVASSDRTVQPVAQLPLADGSVISGKKRKPKPAIEIQETESPSGCPTEKDEKPRRCHGSIDDDNHRSAIVVMTMTPLH